MNKNISTKNQEISDTVLFESGESTVEHVLWGKAISASIEAFGAWLNVENFAREVIFQFDQ